MDVAVLSSSVHFNPNWISFYYSETIFQGNPPTGNSVWLQPQEWALGGNLLSARTNIKLRPNKWRPYRTPILLFVRLRVLFHLILWLAELSKHSTSKYSTNNECSSKHHKNEARFRTRPRTRAKVCVYVNVHLLLHMEACMYIPLMKIAMGAVVSGMTRGEPAHKE